MNNHDFWKRSIKFDPDELCPLLKDSILHSFIYPFNYRAEVNGKTKNLIKTSSRALEMTGATSADRPGLTSGEQMGGMWNSTATQNTNTSTSTKRIKTKGDRQQQGKGGKRTDGSFVWVLSRGRHHLELDRREHGLQRQSVEQLKSARQARRET